MRIIAGRYRGRRLKSPPSLQTRPTSDRLRETLFNIVARKIEGARFLDLCAGSGAVGIEALSRGAAQVTFVDRSRKMYALIQTNLKSLEVNDDEIEVVSREVLDFLQKHVRKEAEPFDLVFFDPPYASDYEEVLRDMGEHAVRLISNDGMIIVEHGKRTVLSEGFAELQRFRSLRQGDSCLSFYRIRG
jgi:16S rRNA (guanine966-N2)-methyltransferase